MCLVGVTAEMLPSLHYYCTPRNLNMWMKCLSFHSYNGKCPLVVLVHFSDVSLQNRSPRSRPKKKKKKVFVSGIACMSRRGRTGNHMYVDIIISHSPAGLSVGTKSSLLSRTCWSLRATPHETQCYCVFRLWLLVLYLHFVHRRRWKATLLQMFWSVFPGNDLCTQREVSEGLRVLMVLPNTLCPVPGCCVCSSVLCFFHFHH